MSKVFYDSLLDLEKIDKTIKKVSTTHEEKIELWQLVDEILHHKVMGCILDHLPYEHHKEFLQKFYAAPHDERLLTYLKERVKKDIITLIKEAVTVFVLEIIGEIETNKLENKSKKEPLGVKS